MKRTLSRDIGMVVCGEERSWQREHQRRSSEQAMRYHGEKSTRPLPCIDQHSQGPIQKPAPPQYATLPWLQDSHMAWGPRM